VSNNPAANERVAQQEQTGDPSPQEGGGQKPRSTWRDLLELIAALDLAGIIILPLVAIVAAVFWCFGISLDHVRQYLERPQPAWNEMSAGRKAMRLLLTFVGTAIFASPFIWFAWLLAQK
jgi:hypothetical protein